MRQPTVGIVCLVFGVLFTARGLLEGTYDGSLTATLRGWALDTARCAWQSAGAAFRALRRWVARAVDWITWQARQAYARVLRRPRSYRMSASGGCFSTVSGSAQLKVGRRDLDARVRALEEEGARTSQRLDAFERSWEEWRVAHETEAQRHALRAFAFGVPGAILLFGAGLFLS